MHKIFFFFFMILGAYRAIFLTVEVNGVGGPVATLRIDLEKVKTDCQNKFPDLYSDSSLRNIFMGSSLEGEIKNQLKKNATEFEGCPYSSITLLQGKKIGVPFPEDTSKPLQITVIKQEPVPYTIYRCYGKLHRKPNSA